MIAVHGFGLLVSSTSRGPVLALAGSLATILLWDVFKEDLGDARWFVFASHAPTFADGSGMREMASFARGMSDADTPKPFTTWASPFPCGLGPVRDPPACLAAPDLSRAGGLVAS